MDSSTLAKSLHLALKNLGHEMPLGHVFEALAHVAGYKSWNVAKKLDNLPQVVEVIQKSESHYHYDRLYKMRANDVLNRLEEVARNGLPRKYDTISDSITRVDFSHFLDNIYKSCLPCDDSGRHIVVKLVLESEKFDFISNILMNRYSVDVKKEFNIQCSGAFFEVKVNARIIRDFQEIELKKYYRVVAQNAEEARDIVQGYLEFRNGNMSLNEICDEARSIASIESEEDFKFKNWEVIYLTTSPEITDVQRV